MADAYIGLRGKAAISVAHPSSHSFRSMKRHRARLLQQHTIDELQKELQLLKQIWWDDEFCWIPVRRTVEPRVRDMVASLEVHRERCHQKGRHFHYARHASIGHGAVEQALHRAANKSKHDVFFEERICPGKDSGELDVFSMLSGMVHLNTSSNMGALLVADSTFIDPVEHGDGESLLNVLHAKRDASDALVAEVITKYSNDNWSLRIDDLVFVGQETRPSIVMRIGFDSY